MNKTKITQYLQDDSKTLKVLLSKLNQLKQWNAYLAVCLKDIDALSDHCQIVSRSGDALIVIADSAHWVTRLRFYIPDLLPQLKHCQGLETIKAICCKVNPLISAPKSKKQVRQTSAISAKTAEIFAENANKIQDESLRLIMLKIANHLK